MEIEGDKLVVLEHLDMRDAITRVFRTKNVLRALGNAKISWDEVEWEFAGALEKKIGVNKLGFMLCEVRI